MESMICSLPHRYSIHMSSGYNAAIATKPYCSTHFSTKPRLSFSHSSFSLPRSTSRGRPLEHIVGPMTFTVGHPLTSHTDQKNRSPQVVPKGNLNTPPQAFPEGHLKEVEEVSKVLKKYGHLDIALQLLKMHDAQLDIKLYPTDYYKIKMEILDILIAKKIFDEAWRYSEDIEKNKSKYDGQFPSDLLNALQCKLGHYDKADQLRAKENPPPAKDIMDNKQPPPVEDKKAEDNKDNKPPSSTEDNKDSKPLSSADIKPSSSSEDKKPQDNKDNKPPSSTEDNKDNKPLSSADIKPSSSSEDKKPQDNKDNKPPSSTTEKKA